VDAPADATKELIESLGGDTSLPSFLVRVLRVDAIEEEPPVGFMVEVSNYGDVVG
jgi:hypothetical protein